MFRVPSDEQRPTFDETFSVGLRRWLLSSRAQRREWMRRRAAAMRIAQENQTRRLDAWQALREKGQPVPRRPGR